MKTIVSVILRSYKILPPLYSCQDLKRDFEIVMHIKTGVNIRLINRRSD